MIVNVLKEKHCVPAKAACPRSITSMCKNMPRRCPYWKVSDDEKKITREFTFKDFVEAMKFVNAVADIAQAEGHHPDMYIFYNKVRLDLTTHAVNGLFENDFILAAKIDAANA